MFRRFSNFEVIMRIRESIVVAFTAVFLVSCNMAPSVSKGVYDELVPINELFDSGQYGDALKLISRLENDIDLKRSSNIDRKMIFSLKSAVLWQLDTPVEAVKYMRLATEIKTGRKDYELSDLDSLAKMCVTIEDVECAEYAFNCLNSAIVSDLRDGDLKLISDWSGKIGRTVEHKKVDVQFRVSAAGIPSDIVLIEDNVDSNLAAKAIRKARAFRYIPKVENGIPVETPNVRVSIYLMPLLKDTTMMHDSS